MQECTYTKAASGSLRKSSPAMSAPLAVDSWGEACHKLQRDFCLGQKHRLGRWKCIASPQMSKAG